MSRFKASASMQKVTISIVIFVAGLIATFLVQYLTELNRPVLADFSIVSQAAPVIVEEIPCNNRRKCSERIQFTIKNVSFTVNEYFPFYRQVKQGLPTGRVRVWYDASNNNKIVNITQNGRVIAPFEKLVHVQGYASSVTALIPFGLVIFFLMVWWRASGK
ncbi:hypothetical protein N473_09695 [Pseudoalteromonas luteoviolacea CPMOR-1]|uniref:DUF3592 domain-containing protein n=2 Tax=Pseudoalteromonas luteoviolacea TaxID=43657 RepID=A0A167MNA0_9GAMM|nr:hypothetical protein N473_09695 [Pseudoalteromonas luteoviolacea CPMOR-1]